jgi:hypothetical protein
MVRLAISVEAFEAIASTLPLGSVGYENRANERERIGNPFWRARGKKRGGRWARLKGQDRRQRVSQAGR